MKNHPIYEGRIKNLLKGKSLLVINTGNLKKKFILQNLKKSGVTLVVLNKTKNWAQSYVDHWILVNPSNHQKSIQEVGKFLRDKNTPNIDGVLTFWEDDVILTSKICEKYNFTGINPDVAKMARNKYLFREFCLKNQLPTVGYKIIKSVSDFKNLSDDLKFPLIIKPVFGSGSAFVIKVNDLEELNSTYQYIEKNIGTNIESALADGLDIMVEEYIDGEEVDVDILIQNGRIKFAAVSDNTKTQEPFFIEADRLTPSLLSEDLQEDIILLTDKILEKMNLYNGCIHFEAKIVKNKIIPIEMNLRMGGDEIYYSIKASWGCDLILGAAYIALNEYLPKFEEEKPRKYLAARTLITEHSGILSQLAIDSKIKKLPFVEEIEVFKKVGDVVLLPPEGYDYLGWVLVSGDNAIDAQQNLDDVTSQIKFEVARFHPNSSIGRTTRTGRLSVSTFYKKTILGKSKIEKIRTISIKDLRKLHIGIACNAYNQDGKNKVHADLSSVGFNIQNTLSGLGYRTTYLDFNNINKVIDSIRLSDIDIIFNVCERINDSSLLEPHAASLLDILQVPYTGSNPFTLGLCIDKIRVKKLLNFHKIPTPKWDYLYNIDDSIRQDFNYPLIVKPSNSDNSIGITNDSVVTNEKDLRKQIKKILIDYSCPVLVEEYIEGDEYDVSILGSEEYDLRVLPLSRSIFTNMPKGYWHIFAFDAKFGGDDTYKKHIKIERPPNNINKNLTALISEIALDTYNILDCHDYGRVEIRVDKNNNPYVLELNPNPSINIGDCVPTVAGLIGYDYGLFLEEILRMTVIRYKNNPPYYHLQTNII